MGLLAVAQIAVIARASTWRLGYAARGSPAMHRHSGPGVVPAAALWLVLGYVFYCTAYSRGRAR